MVREAADERDKTSTGSECPCAGNAVSCVRCEGMEQLYWCETCRQEVAVKRCPLCGLKARKIPCYI